MNIKNLFDFNKIFKNGKFDVYLVAKIVLDHDLHIAFKPTKSTFSIARDYVTFMCENKKNSLDNYEIPLAPNVATELKNTLRKLKIKSLLSLNF